MKIYIKVSMYLGVMLMVSSLFLLITSILFFLNGSVLFIEWELFSFNSVNILMLIIVDWMSLSFSGLVLMISSVVMLYMTDYMSGDLNYVRFTWMVYLFVLSMFLLIFSPNMISILLGWDGLGLVSYCLVIYYQNVKSANAGMLTILMNRVGDVAILLCISWMFNYGGWNFFYLPWMYSNETILIIEVLVILAAMTKSAQIPFSAWLPAAMAAPTPVSSLVHSSTLVTAGVYLLIRFSELVGVNLFLLFVSIMTMLVSGINANLEMDLKKVIALSTLSQLGVMMMTISVGLTEMAFFHMLSHALFKSLLFLCAGVVIHGMGDIQDVRDLGGLSVLSPVTTLYFLVCSLSLCGFPYMSGFYSKDILLEMLMMGDGLNFLIFSLIILSILLTGIYSTKLAFMLFMKPLGVKKLNNLGEVSIMIYPMSLLFYSAIMGGSAMFWWFAPPLVILFKLIVKVSILSMVVFLFLVVMGFMFSVKSSNSVSYNKMVLFMGGMFFMPYLSTFLFLPWLKVGKMIIKIFDHGWLELLGGQGFMISAKVISFSTDKWNFLSLKLYLSMFFLVIMVILIL
uniref:NADH-ubiquinone oxidoreductase chain 5 n=1 Tax=Orthonychiurus folsomi TaxID=2581074 RepID=A0A650DQY6_9HEXA|nr:NADH dehydrogenase subunit 5 [Orthonychiurus folsomi]